MRRCIPRLKPWAIFYSPLRGLDELYSARFDEREMKIYG